MKIIVSLAGAIAACTVTVSADVAMGPAWGYRTTDESIIHTSEWDTNWAACGGNHQSPIDIDTAAPTSRARNFPLKFSGHCPTFNLTEPHEPLEVDVSGGAAVATVLSES